MSPDTVLDANAESLPLAGVGICLIFEHSLAYYTRLLQEIRALQEAGAIIELVTSNAVRGDAPDGIAQTFAPLWAVRESRASRFQWRPVRGLDNRVRRLVRPFVQRLLTWHAVRVRVKTLRTLADRADILWVIDEPSLPTAVDAVRGTRMKIVYETVDLVPEYGYRGGRYRRKRLEEEGRLISRVDGFITACDSYADYYMERYGRTRLSRRPVVRDNMPEHIAHTIRPVSGPLRLLFLGSLMFDRPVAELIEAMHQVSSDVTLTFQGRNLLEDEPSQLIERLGLADRVQILDPCPPEQIVDVAREYDVGIVALRGNDENERWASTSKLFAFMSAGLAILGSDLPGVSRVVQEHRNGILVEGMDAAKWARAIDELASMPCEDVNVMKQGSLDAAQSYSWERQKPVFLGEFARALGRDRGRDSR